MFTSCCPGWVRFVKQHYPRFTAQLSSAKSPHQMMGAVVKNTLAAEADEAGKRLFVVSIMPCVAKKYECDVPELATEADADVDAVLTVREFDRLLRMVGVNCAALTEIPFDNPLGLSTGAATIFRAYRWRDGSSPAFGGFPHHRPEPRFQRVRHHRRHAGDPRGFPAS